MYNISGSFYYTNTKNYKSIKTFLPVISAKWAYFSLFTTGPYKTMPVLLLWKWKLLLLLLLLITTIVIISIVVIIFL